MAPRPTDPKRTTPENPTPAELMADPGPLPSSEPGGEPQLQPGAELAGRDLSGLDLSGVDLSGANLAGADLSGAVLMRTRLVGANLERANLEGAELLGADLGDAHLEGARLARAGLGGSRLVGALLFGADLSEAALNEADLTRADLRTANLQGARLAGANLRRVRLTRADLRGGELTTADVTGAEFDGADLRGARLSGLRGYQRASWVDVDLREADFTGARLVERFIRDQNYIEEFRTSSRTSAVVHRIWSLTSDCGRSVLRWGLTTFVVVVAFGLLYTRVAIDYGEHETVLSPIYFSLVTMTTLGYGDCVPVSAAAQVAAMCEVVLGYVMLGGMLSIFSNRMARRAD